VYDGAGSAPQLKSTAWSNPLVGVRVIVYVALFPAVTVLPEGEADSE
jgi:hypothetical protein